MKLVSKKVNEILKNESSLLSQILNHDGVHEVMKHPEEISSPWYGQLMGAAQIMAYIIQLDFWLNKYGIDIKTV